MKCTRFLMAAAMVALAARGFAAADARYVTVEIPKDRATLSLAEVEVFSGNRNVAPTGKAEQSDTSNGGEAKRAIDGNTSGAWSSGTITHSIEGTAFPTWELDLGKAVPCLLYTSPSPRDA